MLLNKWHLPSVLYMRMVHSARILTHVRKSKADGGDAMR